mgnify:CR=1 FL=1
MEGQAWGRCEAKGSAAGARLPACCSFGVARATAVARRGRAVTHLPEPPPAPNLLTLMHQVERGRQHDAARNGGGDARRPVAHAAHEEEGQRAEARRRRHDQRHEHHHRKGDGLAGAGGALLLLLLLPLPLPLRLSLRRLLLLLRLSLRPLLRTLQPRLAGGTRRRRRRLLPQKLEAGAHRAQLPLRLLRVNVVFVRAGDGGLLRGGLAAAQRRAAQRRHLALRLAASRQLLARGGCLLAPLLKVLGVVCSLRLLGLHGTPPPLLLLAQPPRLLLPLASVRRLLPLLGRLLCLLLLVGRPLLPLSLLQQLLPLRQRRLLRPALL